jgi:predicted TIM-barrel fold metal-dependent hydrolase
VLSALAKNYANVYIDMCWAHIISPEASIRAMVEWIDSVPLDKISAFGADYSFIDAVYGHQELARDNVSRALAIKVAQGLFDVDKACEIARLWFYDNPLRIFQLAGKL